MHRKGALKRIPIMWATNCSLKWCSPETGLSMSLHSASLVLLFEKLHLIILFPERFHKRFRFKISECLKVKKLLMLGKIVYSNDFRKLARGGGGGAKIVPKHIFWTITPSILGLTSACKTEYNMGQCKNAVSPILNCTILLALKDHQIARRLPTSFNPSN